LDFIKKFNFVLTHFRRKCPAKQDYESLSLSDSLGKQPGCSQYHSGNSFPKMKAALANMLALFQI
jgi:hypothetical protein